MFPRQKGIWKEDTFQRLLSLLKKGKSMAFIAKDIGVAESGVENVIAELKRAAKAGMDLSQYVRAGRPCQYGKKVLA
jgi:methionine salvage enolase-phosphatase E1